MSQSSGSVSSANSRCLITGPLCKCGKATSVVKSWTDENPGRRFYRCVVHGFFVWADEEKPHGWQKERLVEARDEIRRLKDEVKVLKASIMARTEQEVSGSRPMSTNLGDNQNEEENKLESDALAAAEREKLLRQFIVLSWGGFIVVVAMILGMVKN